MYIVIANRYGDPEKHSYVVGIYESIDDAASVAVAIEHWRGGKYECEIKQFSVNRISCEKVDKAIEDLGAKEFTNLVKKKIEETQR